MEDPVDLPSRGDMESGGSSGDDFLDFKQTSPLHLEFLGPSHMKIGHFQPYFLSDLPESELTCYLLLHFLLGYLVGSHSVVMSGREI